MLTSKNGKEVWHTDPTVNGGRRRVSNVLKTAPEPTRYANRQVDTVRLSFELLIQKPLVETIRQWTNKEGRRVYKDKWNDVAVEELYKVIGLMVLIGQVEKRRHLSTLEFGKWTPDFQQDHEPAALPRCSQGCKV